MLELGLSIINSIVLLIIILGYTIKTYTVIERKTLDKLVEIAEQYSDYLESQEDSEEEVATNNVGFRVEYEDEEED